MKTVKSTMLTKIKKERTTSVFQLKQTLADVELQWFAIIRDSKATFTDLRNLMRNLSASLACLFYFTIHQCTKLFGPKIVEKIRIKFRRSVNVA